MSDVAYVPHQDTYKPLRTREVTVDGRDVLMHVYVLSDEDGVVNPVTSDSRLRISANPYLYDIAEGNIPTHTPVRRYGMNANVPVTYETINNTSAVQTYLSAAEKLKAVSTSGDDDVGGIGALTLHISGMDSNYDDINETITLTGAVAVETTNSYLRVFNMYVDTAGTHETNVGTITLTNNAGTATYLRIAPDQGQSQAAIYTVPNGYTLYIASVYMSEDSTKGSEIGLFIRPFGGAWRLIRPFNIFNTLAYVPFPVPLKISAKTDVEMRAKGVLADANVTGGFIGWVEEN